MNTEFSKSLARANVHVKRLAEYQPTMLAALERLMKRRTSTANIRQETNQFMESLFQLSSVSRNG